MRSFTNTNGVWFISDTRFGHANIIKYDDRPFNNVTEMDDFIIDGINRVVKADDTLFHLGDFAVCHRRKIAQYRARINCKNVHLLIGNHDTHKEVRPFFLTINDILTIKVGNQAIVLCHYPMESWPKKNYGSWHLHGHVHGSLAANKMLARVDLSRELLPQSFEVIRNKLNGCPF